MRYLAIPFEDGENARFTATAPSFPNLGEPVPSGMRGVIWFIGTAFAMCGLVVVTTQGEPVKYEPTPPQRLVEQHDCWSGRAPRDMEGKRPGHAVVTDAKGRTSYSAEKVGPALAHVFEGKHEGLTVHAFCR